MHRWRATRGFVIDARRGRRPLLAPLWASWMALVGGCSSDAQVVSHVGKDAVWQIAAAGGRAYAADDAWITAYDFLRPFDASRARSRLAECRRALLLPGRVRRRQQSRGVRQHGLGPAEVPGRPQRHADGHSAEQSGAPSPATKVESFYRVDCWWSMPRILEICAQELGVVGQTLYAQAEGDILRFDLSDPAHPTQVGKYRQGEILRSVFTSSEVFVGTWTGLYALRFSPER